MIVPNLSRQPGQESQKDELIASFAEITRVLAEIPRLVKEAEQPELVMAALVFVVVFVGLSLTVIGFWLFYRDRRGPPASPTQNGVSANEMTLSVSLEATLVEHGSEHPQRHQQLQQKLYQQQSHMQQSQQQGQQQNQQQSQPPQRVQIFTT